MVSSGDNTSNEPVIEVFLLVLTSETDDPKLTQLPDLGWYEFDAGLVMFSSGPFTISISCFLCITLFTIMNKCIIHVNCISTFSFCSP